MHLKRSAWFTVVAVAAVAGYALSVVLWSASTPPMAPGTQTLNGTSYFVEPEFLEGDASAKWLNYTFHNVTFGFHLWCSINVDVAIVCGNATEPTSVSYPYSFADGLPQTNPPWQTWVAPDQHEAVQYREGGSARLLVIQ